MRACVLGLWVVLAFSVSLSAQKSLSVFVDPVDATQLRTECLTNPNNYSATISGTTQTLTQWYQAGADQAVADILNTTRAGITIFRSDVAPNDVKEAIAVGQLTTAAAAPVAQLQGAWLNAFFNGAPVRLFTKAGADTRVLANLMALLTNASASETRVRALGSRTGSRAEQLWGCTTTNEAGCEYVTVQASHVSAARALP